MIPQPSYRGAKAPRTLLSESRAEVAAALLGHGLAEECVRELLDLAELHGDAQTAQARVTCDGITWTADLHGPRRDVA